MLTIKLTSDVAWSTGLLGLEAGTASSAQSTPAAFSSFDHQHYSRAVNPAYLEFVDRPSDLGDATKSL
jgi:hypothetical protein